ncbi:MAG: threonine aldolase [Edaphobacter sp.]|nr:threonine aldolase [Edaphobacter sp.]
MMSVSRRGFLVGGVAAGTGLANGIGPVLAQTKDAAVSRAVYLSGDALVMPDAERIQELGRLMGKYEKFGDVYLAAGAVTELEHKMAEMLGKEDAAFLPTGTLANNLAVRVLCGDHRHALVQHESHLYLDEQDSASLLSGINLVPLARGKAAPDYEEVVAAIELAVNGRFPIAVGAISLESPVRRANGGSIPYALAEKISTLARSKGIGMHWDGARALLLTGTDGFDLRRYSVLFDTVYVSLYKYLGAPFGAVLAGNKATIAKVRELRHAYGGLIYHGWQSALPALAALPGFQERFLAARAAGDRLLAGLQGVGGFEIRPVPDGSNITVVAVSSARAANLQARLAKADVHVRPVEDGKMLIFVNETIVRQSTEELVRAFAGTA